MDDFLDMGVSRLAMRAAEELRPALLRINRVLRRQTGGLDLSPLQAEVLGLIERRPGIGVSELAKLSGLRGPTMSSHVAQLEETGFLRRDEPDPEDRRRVGLVATEMGREALETVRRLRTDWLARQIDRLEPEALEALRGAIGPLTIIAEEL